MGKIFIESRNTVFGFNHVYVVYRDSKGKETVIRGGPENENFFNWGCIELEINVPIEQSSDKRGEKTPKNRGQV